MQQVRKITLNEIATRFESIYFFRTDHVALARSDTKVLDSFVQELGLSYKKICHVESGAYLFSDNGVIKTVHDDGNDDSENRYWTRSADGCIENKEDGKLSCTVNLAFILILRKLFKFRFGDTLQCQQKYIESQKSGSIPTDGRRLQVGLR
jgi:hypothetical protein